MEQSSCDIANKKFPPDHLRIFVHQGDVTKDLITTRDKIKHLLFAFSSIENISEDFLGSLPDVENLVLNGNQKFPKLTKCFFQKFPKLTLVYVHNNEDLEIDKDALTDLDKLKILSVQGLKYQELNEDVFKGLNNLKRLSVVKCDISNIERNTFKHKENLEEINLASNNLTGFEPGTFEGLDKLKELSLQNNKLGNIDWTQFNTLPSLEYLDLCDNQMTKFDVAKMKEMFPKIQKINIMSNCFTEEELEVIENELMGLGIKIE
ncbi:P-granule-associated novel protein 1-like [Coccinella septempunctata]|uniref:P-granule-associated novel protein 1-like n=1 Tax=Coccinella septempunctata TaxID=41139 RepID=UPI001D08E972|nr:P-granule-associated novel protein 1-like [Coccinella septempunctata]XP_044763338.1 P-granule-associated novel protein 1-like [Coccinella septempunctata]